MLLIIAGFLCTMTLNSELRTLTAPPPSCGDVVNGDFTTRAKVEGQRHLHTVESFMATEASTVVIDHDIPIDEETPVDALTQPGVSRQPPQVQQQRTLNFKPKRTNEPRTWEIMGNATRPLNFVHIPKAGGTSIFMVAAANGLSWGDCLFPSHWRHKNCPNTTNVGTWPDHPYQAPWWHTPPQNLPTDKNPYQNHDTYAVVRNPYDRAVSEYYYYCSFHHRQCFGQDNADTPDRMNRMLQRFLWAALRAPANSTDYYQAFGHWIPQYDYVYNQQGERLIQHVLHNEHLNEDFPALLRAYGLNFTLPQQRSRSRHNLGAKLSTADLTDKTMKLIDLLFEQDFALGNYEMLTGKVMASTPVVVAQDRGTGGVEQTTVAVAA